MRTRRDGIFHRLAIDEATGCWNYTAFLDKHGYGQVHFRRRTESVHRVVAALFLGFDLKSGLCVLHKCDNPRCCNPEHLFVGTKHDNTQDAMRKGRMVMQSPQIRCRRGHELTPANRIHCSSGGTTCRECHNAAQRRRRRAR